MSTFQAPIGTHDVLGPQSALWEGIVATFAQYAYRYGFSLVMTPMFEEIGVFQRGIGEGSEMMTKEMYVFTDRGERTLHDLDENLAAMKRTWPISRYFNDRAFFDRDRVLFHPGANRASRVVTEAELFEPGRAVLTARGRGKLDEIGDEVSRAASALSQEAEELLASHETVKKAREDLTGAVRRNPLASIGVAFGLGLIFALLTRG